MYGILTYDLVQQLVGVVPNCMYLGFLEGMAIITKGIDKVMKIYVIDQVIVDQRVVGKRERKKGDLLLGMVMR